MKLLNITLQSICGLLIFSACSGNGDKKAENATDTTAIAVTTDSLAQAASSFGTVEFEEPVFDFGQVKEGEVVEHTYTFKNVGDAPLILSNVSASCGCTTPEFSKNPVLPGQTGSVKVVFNSDGQAGKQQKIVTVSSNGSNSITTVQLKGEVLKK